MKKILSLLLGLFFLALMVLGFLGKDVREIRTEIEIQASPEQVWEVLADIERWSLWSPIIKNSSGKAQNGEILDITMVGKETGQAGPRYQPEVREAIANKKLRWRAHMGAGFIFTNEKILELEPVDNGTRLVHVETYRGLLAPIFCSQMEKAVPVMLDSMNQALKALLEK